MSQSIDDLNRVLRTAYVVERELGEGGMACVYLAREVKHDRLVALKVLKPELAHAIGSDRFLREIRVMARLLHPHILPLLDSGEADGLLFYAMPFVEGETLAKRLRREGQLPIDDAIAVARDIASALACAHEHGIVHRDIKPENVLFESGQAVVADFGVAAVLNDAGSERLTWTGMSVGTPLYMSPEQASGVADVDPRSDIYSLGCALYEMLAGEPPFTGSSPQNVLVKRLTEAPVSVRRLRSAVPIWLDEVVDKALQRSPADRFQTADALLRALTVSNSGERVTPLEPSPPAVASASRPNVPTRTNHRRLWVGAAAGVTMLAVGGIALARAPSRGDAAPPTMGFRQITNFPGAELFPSLSPDGAKVVYSRDGDLYLRDVDSGSEVRVTQHPDFDNRQPSFAPDGRRIAFRSEREGGGIFLVDPDGSEKTTRISSNGFNPSWSPDGRQVVFANEGVDEPTTRRGMSILFTVDVQTGERKQLGDIDGVQPSWSPNGKRIAYWSVVRDGKLTSQRDLWTMRADGTNPVPVTNDSPVDWNPVWSGDGRYLLFSSDRDGAMNLWRIRVDENTGRVLGAPQPLTTGGTTSREHIAVAAKGTRTVYVERVTTSNIYKIPFDAQRGVATGPAVAVTSGTRMATEPSVSPDGSHIAFYTLSDAMDLYTVGADGSDLRRLTSDGAKYRSPQWSPDGRTIALHSNRGGNYQIWTVDAGGKTFKQITNTGTITIYPFWSPTGDRVGYVDLGHGVSSISLADPKAGSEMMIAGDLMVRPAWSPDGERIAGTLPPAAGGTGIVVYTLATRAMEKVSPIGDAPQWLADGHRLVFVWKNKLYLEDLATHKTREILSSDRDQLALGSVSRDGKWIYFARTVTEADLWAMQPR